MQFCFFWLDLFWHGAIDPEGRCAQEVLCLVNMKSDQCKAMEITRNGTTTHSVDAQGQVFQCDSTNVDGDCSFLEVDSCYESSLFPSCQFYTTKYSVILEDPSIISNSDAQGLEDSSYILFYSDDACTQWEGLKGVTTGEHVFPLQTDVSVSCEDAIACAIHPQGDKCQSLEKTETTTRILSRVQDGVAQMCETDDDTTCAPIDSTMCMQSEIVPSCYYRMASAQVLLSDPASYITSTAVGTTEAPRTDTPEIPPEEDDSSAQSRHSMTIVGALMMAFAFFWG